MFIDNQTRFPRVLALVALSTALTVTLTTALVPSARAAEVRPVDRVIAVVNDEVITERELEGRIRIARNRLRSQNQFVEDEKLRRQLLEQIILERAEQQHAKQIGIKVTEKQIERAIAAVAKENDLSSRELAERLASEGVPREAFRANVRNQIVRARIRESVIQSRITVSDADIDAYLLAKQGSSALLAQYNVQQIFIQVPEEPAAEELTAKRERAQALRQRLVDGDSFSEVAAAASDAPAGGDLGWRPLKDLPDIFAREIRKMKSGDISPVVRSPAGFHVLQLSGVRDGGGSDSGPPVLQSHVRHILIRPEDGVGEAQILRRLEEIRDRIEAGSARFEDMARQYSVDGSAGRGGDIGWVFPGDTVPAFERAMTALAPGQISAPVRTQFGFHLIQLLERRQQQASEDRRRRVARQAIVRQRTEEAYQEWRAELRDRTYVELRLE